MAPRGVSADEKQKRLTALFHETADVFNLKEVEKRASKEKGIVLQSVKDVLQVRLALIQPRILQRRCTSPTDDDGADPSRRVGCGH
jgi:hypothetical protein